ncbi:MAG: cytochrome c maturation protein CcmE [Pseudomonadota bacterium]
MRARSRRLGVVGVAAVLVFIAAGLVFLALRQNANLFYTPTKLAEIGGPTPGLAGKVGGFVEIGSLAYTGPTEISFRVVDNTSAIAVVFDGIAPDLFQEGAGVVANGVFDAEGVFVADQLLAKHDENYVPRELADIEGPAG